MIVASLAFDAFILGLAGSLLGLLAGDAISLLAYRAVPGYIAAAFAIGGQRIVGASTIAVALSGGLLAAFAAAALPAIVALRGSATAEPDAFGRALSFTRQLRFSDTLGFACGSALVCASIAVSVLDPVRRSRRSSGSRWASSSACRWCCADCSRSPTYCRDVPATPLRALP